ncbi:TBC1 domain family member 25, partial [Orchesella cincta]
VVLSFLQHCAGGQEQHRRFSVDPQLTSFDILKNLIGRAFDMKGEFAINYRAVDDYGGEAYLPMVSDWDLSAAFLSASDPGTEP